jgi:hypothetical protein
MFSTGVFSSKTSAKHQLLLREAVAAVKKGDRAVARTLLREIVHGDPRNPQAWLWMAGVAESVAEVTHCLEKVLEVEPDNQMANERLSMLRLLRYTASDGTGAETRSNAPIPKLPEGPGSAVAVRGTTAVATTGSSAPAPSASAMPRLRPTAYSAPTICMFCQSDIDRKHHCTRCGALASLRSLGDLFANRAANPGLIRTGVERWRQDHEKSPTAESSLALVLGLSQSA